MNDRSGGLLPTVAIQSVAWPRASWFQAFRGWGLERAYDIEFSLSGEPTDWRWCIYHARLVVKEVQKYECKFRCCRLGKWSEK